LSYNIEELKMGKISCKCGHTIIDQTDNLSYKGYLIPDTEIENLFKVFEQSLDTLIEATKNGERNHWIKNNFLPNYPRDLKDSSMINDIITGVLLEATQDVFEREICGRIAIEIGQSNQFKFFLPDSEETVKILNTK
jgi:hypothetical protein